jgi:purine-nucleoside/S-methyl-5'-thioadenosine phosphorylase / adenosine deaminase
MKRSPYRAIVLAIRGMSVASIPSPMMFGTSDRPQPGEAFEWMEGPGGPALVCRPLASLAPHLFTTRGWRLGGRGDEDAWAEVAAGLDLDRTRLVRARQVHGRSVLVARDSPHSPLPDADIIVTDRSDLALAVQAADCVPMLIADRRTGAVAAAHAGWRGMAAGVPSGVVRAMSREFGSRPDDLVVALGPSVGACCYEVGADLRRQFEAAGIRSDQMARWFFDVPQERPGNPSMPGLSGTRRPDHWFFDGWAATRDLLIDAGVPGASVFSALLCTASHPSVLCSYRRDGPPAGRLAGAIRRALRP